MRLAHRKRGHLNRNLIGWVAFPLHLNLRGGRVGRADVEHLHPAPAALGASSNPQDGTDVELGQQLIVCRDQLAHGAEEGNPVHIGKGVAGEMKLPPQLQISGDAEAVYTEGSHCFIAQPAVDSPLHTVFDPSISVNGANRVHFHHDKVDGLAQVLSHSVPHGNGVDGEIALWLQLAGSDDHIAEELASLATELINGDPVESGAVCADPVLGHVVDGFAIGTADPTGPGKDQHAAVGPVINEALLVHELTAAREHDRAGVVQSGAGVPVVKMKGPLDDVDGLYSLEGRV